MHLGEARPQFEDLPPSPTAMVESMRAYGYSLDAAIADLIDNSIAAGASVVWITSHWSGASSWLSVTDNGSGMTEGELKRAMRLGSQSPLEHRDSNDLGRFGLGLKSASFSQCRRLTVFSKTEDSVVHIRRWDLDHLANPEVTGWELLLEPHADSTAPSDTLDGLDAGTMVLWEVMDRVVHGDDPEDPMLRQHFLAQLSALEASLSMIFHRFLERSSRRLKIVLNGVEVRPWNPFIPLTREPELKTPVESIWIDGYEEPITVTGFVLPHRDLLGSTEHGRMAGIKGWNAQQGFYVYRNARLIVAGSWLGLGGARPWTQEEHYKLARIRLDVPNSMDLLWQLDVKKSTATPPPIVRKYLAGLAQSIRIEARRVFAHRGSHGSRSKTKKITRVWRRSTRNGQPVYKIDRTHPLVSAALSGLNTEQAGAMRVMLSIIEETVPVDQIWLDASETPEGHGRAFHNAEAGVLRATIFEAYRIVRKNRNLSAREAVDLLGGLEEFAGEQAMAILFSLLDQGDV